MYEERYNPSSGYGEQPELELFLLSNIFQNVERVTDKKRQHKGVDYICDGKYIDTKIDYYDSNWDFCFETVGRGFHSWTDGDHWTDFIFYIKPADKTAYLIDFHNLQKFKLTDTFKKRREYPCGDGARCKFFKLGTEIPIEKSVVFSGCPYIFLKKSMSIDKKFINEV